MTKQKTLRFWVSVARLVALSAGMLCACAITGPGSRIQALEVADAGLAIAHGEGGATGNDEAGAGASDDAYTLEAGDDTGDDAGDDAGDDTGDDVTEGAGDDAAPSGGGTCTVASCTNSCLIGVPCCDVSGNCACAVSGLCIPGT